MMSFMKDEEGQDNLTQANTSSGNLSSSGETAQAAQETSQETQGNSQAVHGAGQAVHGTSQAVYGTSLTATLADAGGRDEAHSEDFLVPSSSGKKVKCSTIILGVVFLVGAASLFLMIKKIGPSQAQAAPSQDDLKIESAIQKLSGSKAAITGKMNAIVDRISRLTEVDQVSVEDLKRNPFVLDNSFGGVDVSDLIDKKRTGDGGLSVWSIMDSGDQMRCIINGRAYNVGDQVGDYTVKSITEKYVELNTGESVLVLRMSR
ncbi:MAG: hypothetical protein K9M75_08455 [Phycisphaerae bacterium]|nr:hypothetical protein [Phycisphaerae bacterium]